MARDPKIEVAALNVRIPSSHPRAYKALISKITNLKRGIRVRGDNYCAISVYYESANIGLISKYTEIDIDGEWFDIEDFEAAAPEKVDEINIPRSLKPNHSTFIFTIDESLHTIVF